MFFRNKNYLIIGYQTASLKNLIYFLKLKKKKILFLSYNQFNKQEIEIDLSTEKKKILFTMFGWNESGGGTILPKEMAKSLVKRGFDVTVFYAGLNHPEITTPYYIEKTVDDGVKLIGVFKVQVLSLFCIFHLCQNCLLSF